MPFVVVTGIDGCGKSTQVERLARALEARGVPVAAGGWRLEDVEGTFVGDLVKRVSKHDLDLPPPTTALLLAANASYRLERHVRPALAAGRVVLEDDAVFKMVARAAAYGLDAAWLADVFRFWPRPDVGVLLDVPPERALARLDRPVTAYECGFDLEDRAGGFVRHQTRVRKELLALAPHAGLARVDGDRPADVVTRDVLALVERALPREARA